MWRPVAVTALPSAQDRRQRLAITRGTHGRCKCGQHRVAPEFTAIVGKDHVGGAILHGDDALPPIGTARQAHHEIDHVRHSGSEGGGLDGGNGAAPARGESFHKGWHVAGL